MTSIQAAVVRKNGQEFAIVAVRDEVVQSDTIAQQTVYDLQYSLGEIPVVLMSQDKSGRPTFYGPSTLALESSHIPLNSIEWRDFHSLSL